MLEAKEYDITKLHVGQEYIKSQLGEVMATSQEIFVALYGETRKHVVRRVDAGTLRKVRMPL